MSARIAAIYLTCPHQLLRAHYQVIRLKDDNIETCVISFQKNCVPEHTINLRSLFNLNFI